VVTDIFVAWGHQQEKDSPLTVDEIAQFFDQRPGAGALALRSQWGISGFVLSWLERCVSHGHLRAPKPHIYLI